MIIAGSILVVLGLIIQLILYPQSNIVSSGAGILAFMSFIFLFVPGLIFLIIGFFLRKRKRNIADKIICVNDNSQNDFKINNKNKICYKCGIDVKDEYNFCPKCRCDLKNYYCTNCGAEVPFDFKFCPHCGEIIKK